MARFYCKDHPELEGYENFINLFIPYLKLYKEGDNRYYDEREWRFSPWKGMDGLALCIPEEEYKIETIRKQRQDEVLSNTDNLLYFNFDDIVNVEVPEEVADTIVSALCESFGVSKNVAKNKITKI